MSTLSHQIFELLLQLRVLVVDASYDRMLERAAQDTSTYARRPHPREYAYARKFGCSLFLMNLVLPERYSTTTNLQYRRRIQAGQHGLQ